MIEGVIGWIAATASAVWGLPQCVRILRTRNIDGVSFRAWQATLWSGSSWAAYGVVTSRPQVLWCNVVMLTATISILVLITRCSDRRAAGLWLPSVIGSLTTISALVLWGEAAFTLAMVLPMLGAQSLHLYGAISSAETDGLSVTAFAVSGSSQGFWAAYGFLSGSLPIVVLNVIGTTLMACTVFVTTHRRRTASTRALVAHLN